MAEHAVALLMALNRKMSRASARTNDANFSLDGLVGFDVHGKTVAVVGCGRVRESNLPIHLVARPWFDKQWRVPVNFRALARDYG